MRESVDYIKSEQNQKDILVTDLSIDESLLVTGQNNSKINSPVPPTMDIKFLKTPFTRGKAHLQVSSNFDPLSPEAIKG